MNGQKAHKFSFSDGVPSSLPLLAKRSLKPQNVKPMYRLFYPQHTLIRGAPTKFHISSLPLARGHSFHSPARRKTFSQKHLALATDTAPYLTRRAFRLSGSQNRRTAVHRHRLTAA